MQFNIVLIFAGATAAAVALASSRVWAGRFSVLFPKTSISLRQYPMLWISTFATLILAVAFTVAGGALLYFAPPKIPENSRWLAFRDIGPAVGDLFVISAALFALMAAFVSIIANRQDAYEEGLSRKNAIRQICIVEIQAFWDRANELQLADGLKVKLAQLAHPPAQPVDDNHKLFRRYLGDDWFRLSLLDPMAISELEIGVGGRFLALSARARNLISRFNWLNGARAKDQDDGFWTEYLWDTLQELERLLPASRTMLIQLGDRSTDPATFRFK